MEDTTRLRYNSGVRFWWLLVCCLLCAFEWPGRLERILVQLERPSSEAQRRDLLRLLGDSDDPRAREALARAVADPAPAMRVEALSALARAGDPRFAEPVRTALKDPEAAVRKEAARALAALRPTDVAALLTRSLADSEPAVRAESARLLGTLGDPLVVPALSSALDDASTDVRAAAARALGALGDERGIGPLVSKARDGAPELREAVIDALHELEMRRPGAASERIAPVLGQGLGDSSDLVVFAALRAVTERGVGPWLASLRELAESSRPRVRTAAAALLARAERSREAATPADAARRPASRQAWVGLLERTLQVPAEEVPALLDELEHALPAGEPLAGDPLLEWLARVAPEHQPRVVRLIKRSGARSAGPALAARLEGAPRELEVSLLEALGELGTADAAAPLLARLGRDDAAVRAAASRALGRVGSSAELPRLCELAEQPGRARQRAALSALAGVLERQRTPLEASLRGRVVECLERALERPDDRQFALAARSLALLGGPDAVRALGGAAPLSEPRQLSLLRAASALGPREGRELRQVAGDVSPALRATALSAQALAGDSLDPRELAALATGARWPLGPAAALALARQARPERAAELAPHLCALASARDPWTRANALAGLARLPAIDCIDRDGARWLGSARAPSVRIAAARWAQARTRLRPDARLAETLARCAQRDADELVRATCSGKAPAAQATALATAPARERRAGTGVYALVLPDATVLVTFSDGADDPGWPRLGYIGVEPPWRAPYARE
jgi:HEAT repeat protein